MSIAFGNLVQAMWIDNQTLVFIDCQSTGGSPQSGEILEICWSIHKPHAPECRSHHVIRHETVSKRILQLTGIDPALLQTGEEIGDVLRRLAEDLQNVGEACIIAHYASFERAFVEAAIARTGLDSLRARWLCTFKLSQRLFPSLPCRSIRAAAGFFGYALPQQKRSDSHVAATEVIWRALHAELESRKCLSWQDVDVILNEKAQSKAKRRDPKTKIEIIAREARLALPTTPGVYQFFGAGGQLLYVGKATNLKDRVNSYFRGYTNKRNRQQEMLTQIKDIKTVETTTPLEAALLENDYIKKASPPYNVALLPRNQAPVWTDRRLLEVSETSIVGGYGPLVSQRVIDDLQFIEALLNSDVPISGVEDSAEIWCSVRQRLREDLQDIPLPISRRRLLYLGLKDLRERRRQHLLDIAEANDDEEDPTADDAEPESSPELLYRQCRGMLRGLARHFERARQMRRLIYAEIFIKHGRLGWQQLSIDCGDIKMQKFHKRRPQFASDHTPQLSDIQLNDRQFDAIRIINTDLKAQPKTTKAISRKSPIS
jgi:DNA polymerase III epsilon subunit-like protein